MFRFRQVATVILLAGIAPLLLGVVLFVALVLVPALHLGEGLRKMLIAVAFLGALALIVVKGFISTEKAVNFIAPASASAPGGVSAPAGASAAKPVNPRVSALPSLLPRSPALR
jgi:hypothetical protein